MTANNNSQKNISSIFTSFLSIAILHLGILSFIFLQQDYNPLKELQKFVDFLYRMEIVVLFVLLLLTTYYFFIYLYKNTFSTSSKRLLYFLYVSSILPLSLSLKESQAPLVLVPLSPHVPSSSEISSNMIYRVKSPRDTGDGGISSFWKSFFG